MAASKDRSPKRRRGPTPPNPSRHRSAGPREVEKEDVAGTPEASARYTPPVKLNRGPFRPVWHKVLGAALIVLGVIIFFMNDFSPAMLPGAHNELYAVLGISVAASSVWWFGWFDRPPDHRSLR